MASTANERLVLIGMMGSGKSTVGPLLAARLGWSYVDNDDEVRALTALEPADVIAARGEPVLHAAEAAALRGALASPTPVVIAAAAGVVVDDDCATRLSGEEHVVYLRARPETLRQRIGSGAGRRSDATDMRWLEARFLERDALYQRLASAVVDVDERSPEQIVELIATHTRAVDGGRDR